MRAVAAVMTAAALAQHDAATTARLHPLTRNALDRMWDFQQADGCWTWAELNAPPSEIDEYFGVTMAAIAVGAAPEKYAATPKAQEGLKRIRSYLRDHPPRTMHDRAMLMLAAAHVEGLMTEEQRKQPTADLFALQRPEGGWAMASLGDWKRSDGQPQELISSDGYGTGFATYVLRAGGGIPADDPRLRKAVIWMETHQRASGCWFTRSPRKNDQLSTYTGSVYVILALSACGEIPSPTSERD
jgi:squalene-hopene/tetraprenyl-beta-curcumene cyclase